MPKQVGKDRERQKIKKNRFDEFLPDLEQRIPKNSKKIQKLKKHHYGFSSCQNKLGKAEKDRKKKKNRSDEFLHERNRKFQK